MNNRRQARASAARREGVSAIITEEMPEWIGQFELEAWSPAEEPPASEVEAWREQERLDPHRAVEGRIELWRWSTALRRWRAACQEWCQAHGRRDYRIVRAKHKRDDEPVELPPRTPGPLIFPRWMMLEADDPEWQAKRAAQVRWLREHGVDHRKWKAERLPIQEASQEFYGIAGRGAAGLDEWRRARFGER